MQYNPCFAWMRVGFAFFQKCWRYLIFLSWGGSRPCKLSPFLGLKELKCSHLCRLQKPSAWACFQRRLEADIPQHREKRSPLGAYGHHAAIETIVSESMPLLLTCVANCILGTTGAGPQLPCMCMCYYIHLSVQSSWVP